MMQQRYEVIVIGGGHAGAEAVWACANMGAMTALVTMDPSKIGVMSCNPAIGGLAKGQIVREIDALGGLMGLAADATGIQFRILNASKGPAVHGPRCQSDKYRYAAYVQAMLKSRAQISIIGGTVDGLQTENGRITGVLVRGVDGHVQALQARAVVLTTGTFMRALMHTGPSKTEGGRIGEGSAVGISGALRELGFELGRLKTGTPPRLDGRTIEFERLPVQWGDQPPIPFSELTGVGDVTVIESPGMAMPGLCGNQPAMKRLFPVLEQRPCWITQTNASIHELIAANRERAPLFNGQIDSTGPRYCPSIEDKVFRFADKSSHHVFLEPESLDSDEIYCNGISTSLPQDVQEGIIAQLPGCERAKILRYGYAVEYDMVWPHQIDATGMTKRVEGLFLAGQINGTSGYEEAAGQGLVAGLNAVRFARGLELVRLRRDQAYLGVMMDDLVTKVPREPYRMFTSRAEFRLQLRSDNADQRLTPLGRQWGLVNDARWEVYEKKEAARASMRTFLEAQQHEGMKLAEWVRRPEVDSSWVMARFNGAELPDLARSARLVESVVANIKYAGYLLRQEREVRKLSQLEDVKVPGCFDYQRITGLRTEARGTLQQFRPTTLGQAARLAGITPADVMLLAVVLGR